MSKHRRRPPALAFTHTERRELEQRAARRLGLNARDLVATLGPTEAQRLAVAILQQLQIELTYYF